MINWIALNNPEQLEEILELSCSSDHQGVLIFKHSTRCSISHMALSRLERNWKPETVNTPSYLLDLLAYPEISRLISQKFEVQHESPQVLLIRNAKCVYYASHNAISYDDIEEMLLANTGML
jgi:bacillithiol system protein YtxJ